MFLYYSGGINRSGWAQHLGAPMRAAIYARVSIADQNSELQLREIRDYASRQGWEIVETTRTPSAELRPAVQV